MIHRVRSTTNIHSCSYFCDRPECIKEQRDALVKQKFVPLTDQEIIEAIKHISHNEMSAFAIARALEKFRFGT
jgi:hypothetical protein